MNICRYKRTDFDSCIELFESNADKFFDPSELAQYRELLAGEALEEVYSVVQLENSIIGAGGYFRHKGAFWLDWGLVHRSRHRQGVGLALLKFREAQIYELQENALIKLCTSQHTVGFYEIM